MTDESPVIKRNKKKPKPIAEDPFVSDDDDDFQGIVLPSNWSRNNLVKK